MAQKKPEKGKNNKNKKTPLEIKLQITNKDKKKQPQGIFNNVFFYIFLGIVFYLLINLFTGTDLNSEEIPLGELVSLIKNERIQNITVAGDKIEAQLRDGTQVYTLKEESISFDQIMDNNDLEIDKIAGELKVEQRITFEEILSPLLMFGLPVLLFYFIIRQMKSQGGDILSFGKSRAKVFFKGQSKVTFNDVAGVEEGKREMREIVDFLKNPEKYRKLGARIPSGILLVGPAGVGKTLLAKAIAGEAGVPFFSVAGSEFMEMLVGVGSSRVRDLFNMARQMQPSLIFIDEIDAIGRQRGMGIGGGHDEREQTLNQILIEMDGFDARTDVIVIAATNRPDMLDPALIRPGRFDRRIEIPLPDLEDREEIIKIHMRGKPLATGIDIKKLAKKTVGFSGADIENMLNEAAILAARGGKNEVSQDHLEEAALKVTIGSERKTLRTEEERKITAYHEGGHAIVATFVEDMDPVQRVSIVARGGTLGHTSTPPERDRYNETKTRITSMITTMLGGRAAEEVILDEQTIGASDDIKKASKLARKMVTQFGMSPLGPISFEGRKTTSWLAKDISEEAEISEETAAKIDKEVNVIVQGCYQEARDIIKEKKPQLDKVAEALMEKETLDGDEFRSIIS